ncbi:uncharacterized protein [Dermacentor andersoni]|uniref:uncharacterized protein isoform X2 n=1 Tax=Dermacentor andersoni TaxID=34620 RepID=UPI0021557AF1|nr:mucin-5AC-like isoform X2 [Dermacentor andersoni]
MSIDVEPGTSTMSSTRSEDWSSSWTSGTQSRTNTTTGTMTSSTSAVPSGLPYGITPPGITPSSIPPRALENAMFSGPAQKSQPRPLTDTAKTSDLKAPSEPRRREGALLPFLSCILGILVLLVILSLILSAPYAETPRPTDASERTQKPNLPPAPPTPVVGHVGAPCSDSTACLGEADCVEGVCQCQGTGLRIVKGVCVYSTTPRTMTTRSPTSSTSSRRPSTKTLPSSLRFSFVRTVRLRTTPARSETGAASVTNEDRDRPNTSETGGRARNEAISRGTRAPNVTAHWEEEEEAVGEA